ncbi:MAG: hypothetical protein G3H99_05475 [Ferrovum sp.]|nr:hypothetical protein [Ferrovum sp.]NDU87114.1 hypothetical protein [Ferrovum sp.]
MPTEPQLTVLRQRNRQRLIGVGILAVLAVIFLPLLLDHSRPPKEEGTGVPPAVALPRPVPQLYAPTPVLAEVTSPTPRDAPPPGGAQVVEEKVQLADEPPVASAPSSTGKTPAEPTPSTTPAPVLVVPKAVPHAVPVSSSTESAEGDWIQVGVFAHPDRVALLDKKLRKLGYVPTVESLSQAAEGPRWRIRIGPFATTSALQAALQRLSTLGVKGMRVPGS